MVCTDAAGGPGVDGSSVEVTVRRKRPDAALLVPTGTATPHDEVTGIEIEGGSIERYLAAAGLGLGALIVRPTSDAVLVRYGIARSCSDAYPEEAFAPRRTRHTDAAAGLADAARKIAAASGGGASAIQALAEEAQARFAYAHPEVRFNDGHDAVPHLSCGLTPGSCIDINTYFVASLRAAGFEAAYIYGYFFPEERGGSTSDMHCWVVTRHEGQILEWDIAHHMKAGLGTVRPALNPRPGRRIAIGHSMGHRYALPGSALDLKLLAEPVWLVDAASAAVSDLEIRIA